MKYCPNCGSKIIENSKFCSNCGYDLVLLPLTFESPDEIENKHLKEEERAKQEQLEKERLEKERLEKEAAEKAERERLEKERLEKEAAELAEKERLEREEAEKKEQERLEKERLEQERLEKEKLEKERLEQERIAREEAEKKEAERLEKERIAKEEAEKKAAEKAEKERLAEERKKAEEERLAAEKLEKERLEKEKREAKLALKKAKEEEAKRLKQEKIDAKKAKIQSLREAPISKQMQLVRLLAFIALGLAFVFGAAALLCASALKNPHYQVQEVIDIIRLIAMIAAGVFGLASIALGIVYLLKTARRMAFVPVMVGVLSIAMGIGSLPINSLVKVNHISIEIKADSFPFELTGDDLNCNQNVFVKNWDTAQGTNPMTWTYGTGIARKSSSGIWYFELTVRSDYGYAQIFVTDVSYKYEGDNEPISYDDAIYYTEPFKYGDYFAANSESDFGGTVEYNSMDLSRLTWKRGGGKAPSDPHEGTKADPYTVADAINVAQNYTQTTAVIKYCRGIVKQAGSKLGNSGDIGFIRIKDRDKDNEILIYYLKKYEGCPSYDNFQRVSDIVVGDELVIGGYLYMYNGTTPEFGSGTFCVSINGVNTK